jgi:hypothetical protein
MENKLLSGLYWITGVASLVLWMAVFVPAAHAEKPGLARVVSPTSSAVNRMSQALAKGQFTSVTRMGTPEEISDNAADRMIAAHNLCLAWIARGDRAKADAFCQQDGARRLRTQRQGRQADCWPTFGGQSRRCPHVGHGAA